MREPVPPGLQLLSLCGPLGSPHQLLAAFTAYAGPVMVFFTP